MRNLGQQSRVKNWVRLAAKLSLLLTEPKIRKAIGNRVKDSVDDLTDTVTSKYDEVSDTVASKYEEAVDRLEAAADALQGKSSWPSRVTGFLLGVGVGAGLGILLAPASGIETRETIRDRAVDVKNRVFESAASAKGKLRQSVRSMGNTGTEG
jgi:gas vesicle protein